MAIKFHDFYDSMTSNIETKDFEFREKFQNVAHLSTSESELTRKNI